MVGLSLDRVKRIYSSYGAIAAIIMESFLLYPLQQFTKTLNSPSCVVAGGHFPTKETVGGPSIRLFRQSTRILLCRDYFMGLRRHLFFKLMSIIVLVFVYY